MDRTLKEATTRWLRGRQGSKWHSYECRYVEKLHELIGGDTLLHRITRGTIADVRDQLLETRKPATVNRYLTVLRTVLNAARDDWEWIDSAPKIKRMQEDERVNWITREQARRLIDLLPDHLAAMAAFALCTGLRSANIRELRWEEVSSDLRFVSIPGTKMKNGKDFSAPMNRRAQQILRQQRGQNLEWVFPYRGRPVSQCNTRAFREACRRAGVPGTRFHDLRHTFASWHVQEGTHQAKLRELGGWSSDRMVQRYAHLGKEHLVDAVGATEF